MFVFVWSFYDRFIKENQSNYVDILIGIEAGVRAFGYFFSAW